MPENGPRLPGSLAAALPAVPTQLTPTHCQAFALTELCLDCSPEIITGLASVIVNHIFM